MSEGTSGVTPMQQPSGLLWRQDPQGQWGYRGPDGQWHHYYYVETVSSDSSLAAPPLPPSTSSLSVAPSPLKFATQPTTAHPQDGRGWSTRGRRARVWAAALVVAAALLTIIALGMTKIVGNQDRINRSNQVTKSVTTLTGTHPLLHTTAATPTKCKTTKRACPT